MKARGFNWRDEANRREQILVGLVLVAFVAVFMRTVLLPRTQAVAAAKSRHEALLLERDILKKFLASSPSLQRTDTLYQKKGVKMKILSGEVTATSHTVNDLLGHLSEPSFLGGMEIQKMSFLPESREKGYRQTDFTINLSGNFPDMVRYLERLEQFPALFYLETVNLTAAEGQPQELNIELTGRFFDLEEIPLPEGFSKVSRAGGNP